jgi:hypothetical protein
MLDTAGQGPVEHEQPHYERSDEQRERSEQRPAREIVAPRRPGGTDRLRRRRRSHADTEREDAGRGVTVLTDRAPADRIAGPPRDARHGCDDDAPAVGRPGRSREHCAVGREHLNRT